MMGLAPYGKPVYQDLIKDELVDIKEDGSFFINQKYFDFFANEEIINHDFDELLGVPRRKESDILLPVYADVAASVQAVIEEILLKNIANIKKETGSKNICLAGGGALNSVANGRIARESGLVGLWIQPAAGDAGGALGAALYYHYQIKGNKRKISLGRDAMQGSLLGPEFTVSEIKRTLDNLGAVYTEIGMDGICEQVAKLIVEGNTVAWFQGRMEFGPRALGSRSILADPRRSEMQNKLNLKVKKRESFRPFAPSVLAEECNSWFELNFDSPYMTLVTQVSEDKINTCSQEEKKEVFEEQKHSIIPAVTHFDYSARVQTVERSITPLYHELISTFYKLTGCPVLVNTSFNVRGEPIVCTPEDAFRCFLNTELDYFAIGPFLLRLDQQDQIIIWRLKQKFKLD